MPLLFTNVPPGEMDEQEWQRVLEIGLAADILALRDKERMQMEYRQRVRENLQEAENILADAGELVPSRELMELIHDTVFGNVHPKHAGQLRTDEVDMGRVPAPSPEQIPEFLAKAERKFWDVCAKEDITDPQVAAEALAVYHCEYKRTQYFGDGNSRVARLITDFQMDYMCGQGLRPPIDSQSYDNALGAALVRRDYSAMTGLFLDVITRTERTEIKPTVKQQIEHAHTIDPNSTQHH